MTTIRLLLAASLLLPTLLGAQDPPPPAGDEDAAAAESAAPTEFDKYHMVFLRRPAEPAKLEAERAEGLQRAHLAHLNRMWTEGFAHVAGPFDAPADEPLRGIVLFRGDLTIERVRELAEADPAVRAGRLEVHVLPWYTAKDALDFMPPPAGPAAAEADAEDDGEPDAEAMDAGGDG